MAITREFLQAQIIHLQRQVAAYTGAIEFAEMLISKLDENAGLPLNEFAEMVAGAGATATIQEE